MNKEKFIYLAGIVDGEGHITIARHKTDKYWKSDGTIGLRKKTNVMYQNVLGVRNTDLRLMDWLKETFGGNYYKDNRKTRPEKWKISYCWHSTSNEKTELILLGILPYLILKREQAKIVLENIRLGIPNPEKREQLFVKVKALNKRGKPVETNTLDAPAMEPKIEPVLIRNDESGPVVTQVP
jgi:hypothetical protein